MSLKELAEVPSNKFCILRLLGRWPKNGEQYYSQFKIPLPLSFSIYNSWIYQIQKKKIEFHSSFVPSQPFLWKSADPDRHENVARKNRLATFARRFWGNNSAGVNETGYLDGPASRFMCYYEHIKVTEQREKVLYVWEVSKGVANLI